MAFLLRLAGRTAGVALVIGAGAGAQMAALILLGRALPEADYGRFALVLSLASVVSTLALLGQASALAQAFAVRPPSSYRWRAPVAGALLRSAALTVVLSAAAGVYYGLSPALILASTGAGLGLGVTQIMAAGIIRNSGRMLRGMWILRGWPIPLLAALAGLAAFGALGGDTAVWALCGALLLGLAVSLTWGVSGIREGEEPLTYPLVRMGLLFWIGNVTLMATRHLDRLVLGGVLGEAALGSYQAVLTLVMAFDLVMVAAGYVLLPILARQERVALGTLSGGLAGVALLGGAGYALLGAPVLHLAYGGRYDAVATLLPWLVAAGMAKVIYALPTALIGGRLGRAAVRRFAWLNVPLLVIHLALTLLLALRHGLAGAAAAQAAGWTLRCITGYVVVALHRRELANPPEGPPIVAPGGGTV